MLLTVSPMTCLDTRPTSDGMCFSDDDVCPLVLCFLVFLVSGSVTGKQSGKLPHAGHPNGGRAAAKEEITLRLLCCFAAKNTGHMTAR
jgi:hypothetical protein